MTHIATTFCRQAWGFQQRDLRNTHVYAYCREKLSAGAGFSTKRPPKPPRLPTQFRCNVRHSRTFWLSFFCPWTRGSQKTSKICKTCGSGVGFELFLVRFWRNQHARVRFGVASFEAIIFRLFKSLREAAALQLQPQTSDLDGRQQKQFRS